MNTIQNSLQDLGLTEKEAKVYIALLQMGQGSAYAVASKSGLKKPTTYLILGELMQKGLVLKIPRQRKQLFVAKPPDEFFAEMEKRFSVARAFLPDLLAMGGRGAKVRSIFYEGISGMRQALWYRMKEMREKELVAFFASQHDASEDLATLFREWNEENKKHKIQIRAIAPDNPSLTEYRKADAEFGRSIKVVPASQYSANISIDIGDTFVRILMFRDLQGVIIENPDVARTVREIFEMVWRK
jgi:hypothetical protein